MNRFLSTNYTENSFNLGALLLRLTFGLLICINHGFQKLMDFSHLQYSFFDPFHIGHRWSLVLVLFAEVFCALLLVLGLFTRAAALVLVINMAVAAFMAHKGQSLAKLEPALTYLSVYFSLLLIGPGKFSVDRMMGR